MPEIWAIGERSQEGLTFDNDGNLWETEHGPRGGDELNLIKKGANYGWPVVTHGIDYPGNQTGDSEVSRKRHRGAGLLLGALHGPVASWPSTRATCSRNGRTASSSSPCAAMPWNA